MAINYYTDNSVVFPTVQGVAAYKNEHGDIVLSQEGLMGGDDSFVYIPLSHAKSLIAAIEKLCNEGNENEVV